MTNKPKRDCPDWTSLTPDGMESIKIKDNLSLQSISDRILTIPGQSDDR